MDNYIQPKVAEALQTVSRNLTPDSTVTVTSCGVIAQIGSESFLLNNTPYEMQADLESIVRLLKLRRSSK